jgi:plasmid replication initiation protein
MTAAHVERQHMVVKANDLIQKSKYSLTFFELRLVQYVLSLITPEMETLQELTFDIQNVCKVLNIDEKSGGNYNFIKESLKRIRDYSVWINYPNGKATTFAWFSNVAITPNSGKVTVYFDKISVPFLIQLKKHYTQYSLFYTLAMKSSYSIRLYELLKSYQNLGVLEITFDDLRERLDVTSEYYSKFGVFRQKILDASLQEIERFTDLHIEFETIRKGRVINKIKFIICEKRQDYSEYHQLYKDINENIGAQRKRKRKNSKEIEGQIEIEM